MIMLKELIDFVDASFPSIPYGEKNEPKKQLNNLKKLERPSTICMIIFFLNSHKEMYYQIFHLFFFDTDGTLQKFKAKAMVINTSCHIENKNYLTLVPVVSVDEMETSVAAVKSNKAYEIMYIPDTRLSEYCIDFSMPVTYDTSLIKEQIEKGNIIRIASLSQIGYYLLLIKLNIYLMRREDPVTMGQRKN